MFLDSCCNAAGLANRIDRAHNVLASAARERQVEANAQRSAEQRSFHVVTGKWISGEKSIDVPGFNEPDQMLIGTGPHDRWTGHNCDFAFRPARASKFLSQFANNGRFRFISVDDRVDELKNIRARRRALHRHHAYTLVANDDFVAFMNVEEFNGSRG